MAVALLFPLTGNCSRAAQNPPIVGNSPTLISAASTRAWQGWGCALYWWANVFGHDRTLCDICFGHTTTNLHNMVLPELGFNIVRYNLGGSGPGMVASPPMPAFKAINGFWLSPTSTNPQSTAFDWNADAAQVAALKTAMSLGADHFEIASNSPMWWMCTNGSSTGSNTGEDNLLPKYYAAFAYSLALAARQARTVWHVPVGAVEPFNEPSAWWWKFPGRQEGCHFDPSTQAKIIPLLRAELDRLGMNDIKIAASDENSPPVALTTWNSFSPRVRKLIGRVNTHGYDGLSPYRGPAMAELRKAVGNLRLWMSEDGDGDASGMTMAQTIAININQLGANAWCYWQPYDSGGWGLIASNPGDNWVGSPNTKYFMMAQFSRHIVEHMLILRTSDSNTVAAYSPAQQKLVIVAVNPNSARVETLRIKGLTASNKTAMRWVTTASGSEKYQRDTLNDVRLPSFTLALPAHSVTTIELKGVHKS